MALTVYEVQAHGHDWNHDDYGHVNIIYRYGNSKPRPRPDWCKRMRPCGRIKVSTGACPRL